MFPVIVTVAVDTVQVGCVIVTAGEAGVTGCALMVILVTGEMHPAAFLAKTVWFEPAAKPL